MLLYSIYKSYLISKLYATCGKINVFFRVGVQIFLFLKQGMFRNNSLSNFKNVMKKSIENNFLSIYVSWIDRAVPILNIILHNSFTVLEYQFTNDKTFEVFQP